MQTETELLALVDVQTAQVSLSSHGGLVAIDVNSELCSAQMFVMGGQVMRFVPTGHRPVLHVSQKLLTQLGKPLRGGIPVCFPWFGDRSDDPRPDGRPSPKHGFLRHKLWHVDAITEEDNGHVVVDMHTTEDADTLAIWPHRFIARVRADFGTTLSVSLTVENAGDVAFVFEEALHSYFEVGDVRRCRVAGLEVGSFIDKVNGRARQQHDGSAVTFVDEVDRVYLASKTALTVHDDVLARHIRVDKSGSRTTVLWNPGLIVAQTIPDVGGEDWRSFVCVESANIAPQSVYLSPGATHVLTQRISVHGGT